jgi:hypothetical protein
MEVLFHVISFYFKEKTSFTTSSCVILLRPSTNTQLQTCNVCPSDAEAELTRHWAQYIVANLSHWEGQEDLLLPWEEQIDG